MSVPSGFMLGMSSTTVLRSRPCSVSLVASRQASSIAICDDAISVEWMLHEISTTEGCVDTSSRSSAAESLRGSARRAWRSRISASRRTFSGVEMAATTKGRPSVVGPSVSSLTAGDAAASLRK